MSRTQRLLDLIHLLRSHKFPVTGAYLASELGVSLRTIYRDIGTLQAQGACIDGEPGVGYMLRPGFMLPPLMFSEDELEAFVLGIGWVADRGDSRLGAAAQSALTRIAAVLPDDLRGTIDASPLLIGPPSIPVTGNRDLPLIRQAIHAEHKMTLQYNDLKGTLSTRTVWPFALGYFDHVRLLVAWCELRRGFRNFRTDRIIMLNVLEERYPRRRQSLLREWQEQEGIPSR